MRVQAAPNGREEARARPLRPRGFPVPSSATGPAAGCVRRLGGLDAHHGFDLVVSTDASALTVPFALLRGQVETAAVAAVGLARAASGPVPPAPSSRHGNRRKEARPGRPAGAKAGQP